MVEGWTDGKQALRRLGITAIEVDTMWADAVKAEKSRALLPLWVVVEFHPPTVWAAVAALIAVGPSRPTSACRRAVEEIAAQVVPETAARPGKNKHSRASVEKYVKASHRLLDKIRAIDDRRVSPAR